MTNIPMKDTLALATEVYGDDIDRALEAVYFQGYLAGIAKGREGEGKTPPPAPTAPDNSGPKKKRGRPRKDKTHEPGESEEVKDLLKSEGVDSLQDIVPELETFGREAMVAKGLDTRDNWRRTGYDVMPNALSVGLTEEGALLYSMKQVYKRRGV